MKVYTVRWTKYFVSGNLKGLTYDTSMQFGTLDAACRWISWLHEHIEVPVKAIGSSDYTCHTARIE